MARWLCCWRRTLGRTLVPRPRCGPAVGPAVSQGHPGLPQRGVSVSRQLCQGSVSPAGTGLTLLGLRGLGDVPAAAGQEGRDALQPLLGHRSAAPRTPFSGALADAPVSL